MATVLVMRSTGTDRFHFVAELSVLFSVEDSTGFLKIAALLLFSSLFSINRIKR